MLIKINQIKNKFLMLITETKTFLRKISGKSDYKRWGNQENLSPDWDVRTRQIATLIEPGSSVIEFGAGRLILRNFLPENCSYTPSDIVDRGSNTIVCDLNAQNLPEFQKYDVAVFSGVLEYINDVPRLVSHLSNFVNVIITSYATAEVNKKKRGVLGWVNNYTSTEFIEIFEKRGFQCINSQECRSKAIKSQMIYKFVKENNGK